MVLSNDLEKSLFETCSVNSYDSQSYEQIHYKTYFIYSQLKKRGTL